MNKLALILVVAAGAGTAHANGFLVNEFDAKAVGRGNASTATDIDPSSIYYNIGGLAAGDGTQVMISGSLVQPTASFTDASSGMKTDSSTETQFLPAIFLSSKITSMIGAGIGFYTPFGLAVEWPTDSVQAQFASEIALHTFFITPSLGLNLGSIIPGLTVGGGIDIVPATIELKQTIAFGTDCTPSTCNAHLGATAVGVGGRIGAMYRPQSLPRLSIGAMWRSNVQEDFEGTGNFNALPEYRSMLPPDGDIKTSITLPQSLSGGVAYRPIDALELEADVIWTHWSKFKTLDITVPSPAGTGTLNIVQPQNYSDETTVRVGAEYMVPTFGFAARAGFIYDPTPVPSTTLNPQLPDKDRYDLTLGASKTLGRYGVHFGALWVLPGSRSTSDKLYMPELKGKYDVSAFVATLTLTGQFNALY